MSRWFQAHLRRGGRVHRDQLPPRLVQQLQRQVARHYQRRAAVRAGARYAWAVLGTLLLLVLAGAALALRGAR